MLIFASVRHALDQRFARHVARQTISYALCPALAAAHAVRTLNKVAKTWPHEHHSFEIYHLKSRFIREAYEAGFACLVRIAEQRMACWRCDGTGIWCHWRDDLADTCRKCDGTGVYQVVELLEFRFVIAGQTFVWHQPRSICGWFTRDVDERTTYEERERGTIPRVDAFDYEVHCETIAAFLDKHSLTPEPPRSILSIRQAIRRDLQVIGERLSRIPQRVILSLQRREDHELPF